MILGLLSGTPLEVRERTSDVYSHGLHLRLELAGSGHDQLKGHGRMGVLRVFVLGTSCGTCRTITRAVVPSGARSPTGRTQRWTQHDLTRSKTDGGDSNRSRCGKFNLLDTMSVSLQGPQAVERVPHMNQRGTNLPRGWMPLECHLPPNLRQLIARRLTAEAQQHACLAVRRAEQSFCKFPGD